MGLIPDSLNYRDEIVAVQKRSRVSALPLILVGVMVGIAVFAAALLSGVIA